LSFTEKFENSAKFSELTQKLQEKITHLINAIDKDVRKVDKGIISTKLHESDSKEAKNLAEDKIKVITETFDKREADNRSGNNESQNSFLFSKNSNGISRAGVNSSIHQKTSAFSEQLQSIVQNARIFIKDNRNGSFSIRLYPESLGRVNVNLGLDQGIITGRFLADTAEARDILLENINIIKEKLAEAGLSVGEFHVNVREENGAWEQGTQEEQFEVNHNRNMAINHEYEMSSIYLHDGEIDMIV